ncbi:unnamed protein product [Debaryomyces fabryi]|nr:unnamed protein product [Debaryomyces fabryi]
MVTPPSIVPE